MGLFSSGSDASKEIKRQEEQRQRAIRDSIAKVEGVFSQFGPDFYEQARQLTLSSLMPQLTQQHQQARQSLGTSLAQRGLLESTVARNRATELEARRELGQTGIIGQATEAKRDLQRQVAQSKSNLINQAVAVQDPALAAQQAVSTAATITAPSFIAPLGDLFQGLANTFLAREVGRVSNEPPPLSGFLTNLGKNRIRS